MLTWRLVYVIVTVTVLFLSIFPVNVKGEEAEFTGPGGPSIFDLTGRSGTIDGRKK
jgi:hypothetical protein